MSPICIHGEFPPHSAASPRGLPAKDCRTLYRAIQGLHTTASFPICPSHPSRNIKADTRWHVMIGLRTPRPSHDERTNEHARLICEGRPGCRDGQTIRGLLARVLPPQARPRIPPAHPRRAHRGRPVADGGADKGALRKICQDTEGHK